MIARILSFLFPPRLGRIRNWDDRIETVVVEHGSAGPVMPRRYRNGIERYFAEHWNGHDRTRTT